MKNLNEKFKSWLIEKEYGRESAATDSEFLLFTVNPPVAILPTKQMIYGYMIEYLVKAGFVDRIFDDGVSDYDGICRIVDLVDIDIDMMDD